MFLGRSYLAGLGEIQNLKIELEFEFNWPQHTAFYLQRCHEMKTHPIFLNACFIFYYKHCIMCMFPFLCHNWFFWVFLSLVTYARLLVGCTSLFLQIFLMWIQVISVWLLKILNDFGQLELKITFRLLFLASDCDFIHSGLKNVWYFESICYHDF